MLKNTAPIQQAAKPSLQAVRRAVASSTALETGLTVKQLEQKLQNRRQHRFHTSSWRPDSSRAAAQRLRHQSFHRRVFRLNTLANCLNVGRLVGIPCAVVQRLPA